MAMFADDQEALFAAWQPRAFPGCGLVNEPGCFCWSELACPDTEAAARFYGRVFGWGTETSQMGPMTYAEWRLGGRAVGGLAGMDENWPGTSRPAGSCTSPSPTATRRRPWRLTWGARWRCRPWTPRPAARGDRRPAGAPFTIIRLAGDPAFR